MILQCISSLPLDRVSSAFALRVVSANVSDYRLYLSPFASNLTFGSVDVERVRPLQDT